MADSFDTSDFVPDSAPPSVADTGFSAHDFVPDSGPALKSWKELPPSQRFGAPVAGYENSPWQQFGKLEANALGGIGDSVGNMVKGPSETGDDSYNPVGELGNIAGSAYNVVAAPFKALAQGPAESVIEKYGNPQAKADIPGSGEKLASAAVDIPAIAIPTAKGMGSIIPEASDSSLLGSKPDLSGMKFPQSKAARAADQAAAQELRNTSAVEGVNQTVDKIKSSLDDAYNKEAEMSQGVVRQEPKIQSTVSTLLDDLKSDPAYKTEQGSSQAFRDLEAVNNSFDENGNIPLDSIKLLKKRVNDLYSPDMSEARGKIYSSLNRQLKQALEGAKADNPEWGAAYDNANTLNGLYQDHVVNNPVLSKKWGVEDKSAYEKAQNTSSPYSSLPDSIRQKINNVHNVDSLEQYEGIMRLLPEKQQASFTQDVIKANELPKGNIARIKAAYNAYKDAKNLNASGAARNVYDIFRNPKDVPDINLPAAKRLPHLGNAAEYHSNIAHNAYQDFLDRAPDAEEGVSWLPGQGKISGPKPMLALPAPETLSVNSSGEAYPMSSSEIERAANIKSEAQRFGISNLDDRGVSDPRSGANRFDISNQNTMINSKNANTPLSQIAKSYSPATPSPRGYLKLPAPENGEGFVAGRDVRPMTQSESFAHSDEAIHQAGLVWDAEALKLKNLGYTPRQVAGKIGSRPSLSIDAQFEDAAKRGGFKRGGAVQPTELQKAAGNYKKEHTRVHGLDVSIENPAGSERNGIDKGGKRWSVRMPHAYGYIKGTHGADGSHIDCFLGPNPESKHIHVIDQKDCDTGKFDEHKVMFHCNNRMDAEKAYRGAYSDKRNRIMKTTRFSIAEFKQWLKEGNTKQPVKRAK